MAEVVDLDKILLERATAETIRRLIRHFGATATRLAFEIVRERVASWPDASISDRRRP
jgi:hypothetical protein